MASREHIADNMRTLRKLRGLGQVQLAQAAAVSRRTIARLEAGDIQDPGVAQLAAIAEALGVHTAWLTDSKLVPLDLAVPSPLADRLAGSRGSRLLDALMELQSRD